MAITHFTPQLISRGDGRSAVLSAAYRHCARMEHEAEARTVDYSAKRNLAHEAVNRYEEAVAKLQHLATHPELALLRESQEYKELVEHLQHTQATIPDSHEPTGPKPQATN